MTMNAVSKWLAGLAYSPTSVCAWCLGPVSLIVIIDKYISLVIADHPQTDRRVSGDIIQLSLDDNDYTGTITACFLRRLFNIFFSPL